MRPLASLALVGFAILLLAYSSCPAPRPVEPRACGRDIDCKGERICAHGSCIDPPPRRGQATLPASSLPTGEDPTPGGDGGLVEGLPLPPPIDLPGASPLFHADRAHTGRSRFRVSTGTPRELARIAVGGVVISSPAITEAGLAIFGAHDKRVRAIALAEDGARGANFDVAWTLVTGDLVWTSPALGPAPAGENSHVPIVYTGSDDDFLYALDSATGSTRWRFQAGPCKKTIGFGPEAARCDVDGVNIAPDGAILFVADGAYALNPDGTLRWRYPLSTHCAGSPAVAPDGTVYFGCQDGRLYAIGPDGTTRWDVRTGDDIDSAPTLGPDGTIYVGSDDHKLYAVSPTGRVKWALRTGGDVRGAPALATDGTLYVGSFDGRLYAVHPDGTVAWTFSTADRILSSPVIDAGGVVIFGSQDDRLYALQPDGKLLWSVLLGGDVDGTPAIGPGGTIYVGADDKALHVLR